MAEFDVLCCGLVIADFAFRVPRQPGPDEKLRADALVLCGGGPAANAAAQIARLGGRVAFVGRIGRDALGVMLRAEFAADGVDPRWLVEDDSPTSAAAIVVKPDGARTVVYHRPAATLLPRPDLGSCRVVLVDNHELEAGLALLRAARVRGVPSVVDAGTCNDATRALAAEADHVVASTIYARVALGDEPTTDNLARLGRPGATVVVTLGARGAIWSGPEGAGTHAAFRVAVADTTGAGDSFHGAYALGLARGWPMSAVVRFACAAGALTCTRLGGRNGLPGRGEVEALLRA